MKRAFCFNRIYFTLTIILFAVEVFIGKYVHDSIIRPYGGDFLVVMLIYCFVKSFVQIPVIPTAISVLLFSYLVEGLQYIHIVNKLGLEHNTILRIVIGTSFAWTDIIAYTLGIAAVILLEFLLHQRRSRRILF